MDADALEDLILRYLDGAATPDEVAALSAALRADPAAADLFVRTTGTDALLHGLLEEQRDAAQVGMAPSQSALPDDGGPLAPGGARRLPDSTPVRMARRRSPVSRPWGLSASSVGWPIAAAAVLLGVIGLVWLLGEGTPGASPQSARQPFQGAPETPPIQAPTNGEAARRDSAGQAPTTDMPGAKEEAPGKRDPPAPPGMAVPPPATGPSVPQAPVRPGGAPAETPDAARAPSPEAPKTVALPRPPEAVAAVLDRFQGEVVVLGPDGPAPAKPKRSLLEGQTVQVVGRGAADVRFADGTRVEVQGDSSIVFPAAPDAGARLVVAEGRILADVARQPAGKTFVFATAEAEAVVLGTRLAVTAIPGLTRLDVYQGKVRLDRRSDGATATVGAGQHAIAEKGRPLEAIGPFAPVPRRPGAAAVAGFTLLNGDTNRPVPGFDPLVDGAVLNLDRLPARNLNIRANTVPAQVGSVKFVLDREPFNVEGRGPYTLVGNPVPGKIYTWTPSPGEHAVTATPYESPGAKGDAGHGHTVTFYVIGRAR